MHIDPKHAAAYQDHNRLTKGAREMNRHTDKTEYKHIECIEDFCGSQTYGPGFWADLWRNSCGQELVTFGGCWTYYDWAEGLPEGCFGVVGDLTALIDKLYSSAKFDNLAELFRGCDFVALSAFQFAE